MSLLGKLCPKCQCVKSTDDFHMKKGKLTSWCKECRRQTHKEWYAKPENKERAKRNVKAWAERNVFKEFNRNLQRMYGLNYIQYITMVANQKNKCAICEVTFAEKKALRPHVDHCHSTGKVRGLLCSSCNIAIGLLKDDGDKIRKAADYVERNR